MEVGQDGTGRGTEHLRAMAPHAWLTLGLVAVNVAVWLAMVAQGAGVLDSPADQLLRWGANAASEVQRGEWWRLLTAIFLHGGLVHLAMNMLGLLGTGLLVERIYGRRLFLLVYLGSGLLGSALSLHFAAQEVVSVGASGAVFGLAGALVVAVLQHRDRLPAAFTREVLAGMAPFFAYSLFQGFGQAGIDNAAHVGGVLGGCLIAYVLPERFDMARFRRQFLSRALAVLAATGLATFGLAASAPRATVDQARVLASAPLLERGLKRFDAAMQALRAADAAREAGRRSGPEVDEEGRTVLAPEFRQVVAELSRVTLRPGDPRGPLLADVSHMSALLAELLGMASVEVAGQLEPADPARVAELDAELRRTADRLRADMEALKAGR